MSKYRNKEGLEVGSGDKVTETLLEITPLARQTFNKVVDTENLLHEVREEFNQRQAAARAQQDIEAPAPVPAPIIATASIEIRPTETGTCLS